MSEQPIEIPLVEIKLLTKIALWNSESYHALIGIINVVCSREGGYFEHLVQMRFSPCEVGMVMVHRHGKPFCPLDNDCKKITVLHRLRYLVSLTIWSSDKCHE